MPNVTISVPDDLKAEMDKLQEINWSEVSRKAILKYIDERKNPTPRVEFDVRDVSIDTSYWQNGSPALKISLRIHNRTGSEIIVDRVLFYVRFSEGSNQYGIWSGSDLYKKVINPNSSGDTQLILEMTHERIGLLEDVFKSTFYCQLNCVLFAVGFKFPYEQQLLIKIPIDEWKKAVNRPSSSSTPQSIRIAQ
jgi:hypothetical protein